MREGGLEGRVGEGLEEGKKERREERGMEREGEGRERGATLAFSAILSCSLSSFSTASLEVPMSPWEPASLSHISLNHVVT